MTEDEKQAWLDGRVWLFNTLTLLDEKKRWAAKTTVSVGRRPRFESYKGNLTLEYYDFLQSIKDIFETCSDLLRETMDHFTRGTPLVMPFVSPASLPAFSQYLVYMNSMRPAPNEPISEAAFFEVIGNLKKDIKDGLIYAKCAKDAKDTKDAKDAKEAKEAKKAKEATDESIAMSAGHRQILQEEVEKAKGFLDQPFMDLFVSILMEAKDTEVDESYPFLFNCAPSGSGKTTFALNLCNTKIPIFYWLFNSNPNSNQRVYQPFNRISSTFKDAISKDLRDWAEKRISDIREPDSIDTNLLTLHDNIPLRTVALIVSMFEQLDRVKRDNPTFSWMECQREVTSINGQKMTIQQGIDKLRKLGLIPKSRPLKDQCKSKADQSEPQSQLLPLCTFIDDASLIRSDSENEPSSDSWVKLAFTRSLFRVLSVIPIFAGTDANAINFCSPSIYNSRNRGNLRFWCCIFDDFPGYKLESLKCRVDALRGKFKGSAGMCAIVGFLESIRLYENPWLIGLALDYLDNLDAVNSMSPVDILDQLLHYASNELITRKDMARHFNGGQITYIYSHECDETSLMANSGAENCVHGHLAYLKAYPFKIGLPYFKLTPKNRKPTYFAQQPVSCRFDPNSYYRHFLEAPLTGLVLFGLNLSKIHTDWNKLHMPFVKRDSGSISTRATSFEAIYAKFDQVPRQEREHMINRTTSGVHLKFLFNIAAVISSRASGISGCRYPDFLQHLIREMGRNRDGRMPELECPKHFDDITIPVIAPMSTPAWPGAVVKMLKTISGGPVNLGILQSTTGNESVDSVIYEVTDTNSSKRSRLASTSTEKEYGFHRTIDFDEDIPVLREVVVCECKQHTNALNLRNIKNGIVEHKFKHWPNCDTFIVLTMDFLENYLATTVKILNDAGYYMWFLDKKSKENKFKVEPLKHQESYRPSVSKKNVLIISMRKLWDDDELFDELRIKWGVKIKEDEDEVEAEKLADEEYELAMKTTKF